MTRSVREESSRRRHRGRAACRRCASATAHRQRRHGYVPGFGGIDATVHESRSSPDHSVDEGRVDLFDVNCRRSARPARHRPSALRRRRGRVLQRLPAVHRALSRSLLERRSASTSRSGLSGVLSLSNLNIVPMDVDGDGRSDVLHMPRSANYGYFRTQQAADQAGRAYSPTRVGPFFMSRSCLPDGRDRPAHRSRQGRRARSRRSTSTTTT